MLRYILPFLLCLFIAPAFAAATVMRLEVDGAWRLAYVHAGKISSPAPVVLVFHGFGSDAGAMQWLSRFEEAWPEAIVVYPEGLNVTINNRVRPGWQMRPGHLEDRDLHFVDRLLEELKRRYQVDATRIYAAGFSNGALFTFELLYARAETFAAFAPVAGACGFVRDAPAPRPVLMIHGKKDAVVKLKDARATRDLLRRVNGCGYLSGKWAPGYTSCQPCTSGMPLIWHQHSGGHIWPKDATAHIVRFFKEHTLAPAASENSERGPKE